MWRVAVDRGGTFTDAVAASPAGATRVAKVLSGAGSIAAAALAALGGAEPAELELRVGTTLATNAVLERKGLRVLLVCEAGVPGIFEIGTMHRADLFALDAQPASQQPWAAVAEVGGGAALDGIDDVEARIRDGEFDAVAAAAVGSVSSPEKRRWEEAVCARALAAGAKAARASAAASAEVGVSSARRR